MSRLGIWVAGARPRTLPASLVGILVGTATAARPGFGWGQGIVWWRLALAAFVAMALQIGANYANDYFDGLRGVDSEQRVGPRRLVGSGWAEPLAVRNAALASFGAAAAGGVVLAAFAGWWLLVPGGLGLLAGWFYSGGSRPYGYRGWGEVSVFVFFGFVSAVGGAWVQLEALTARSLVAGVGAGCLTCALLVANNLRDIVADEAAGKRTLAVRLGGRRTRFLYLGLIAGAFASVVVLAAVWDAWAYLGWFAFPFAIPPLCRVLGRCQGEDLLPVLGATGRLALAYAVFLSLGLWLGSALG